MKGEQQTYRKNFMTVYLVKKGVIIPETRELPPLFLQDEEKMKQKG